VKQESFFLDDGHIAGQLLSDRLLTGQTFTRIEYLFERRAFGIQGCKALLR
jgi:hypothetical protein